MGPQLGVFFSQQLQFVPSPVWQNHTYLQAAFMQPLYEPGGKTRLQQWYVYASAEAGLRKMIADVARAVAPARLRKLRRVGLGMRESCGWRPSSGYSHLAWLGCAPSGGDVTTVPFLFSWIPWRCSSEARGRTSRAFVLQHREGRCGRAPLWGTIMGHHWESLQDESMRRSTRAVAVAGHSRRSARSRAPTKEAG